MTERSEFLRCIIAISGAVAIAGCTLSSNTMKSPRASDPWVIRVDFSSDENWRKIQGLISAPQKYPGISDDFYAHVAFINDANFQNKSPHDVVRSLPDDYGACFCFVVDSECIQNGEHPVLVIGFYPTASDYEESRIRKPSETVLEQITTFRARPSQVQSIQNNLSIANMDFNDFANSVDPDGVFRGFRSKHSALP